MISLNKLVLSKFSEAALSRCSYKHLHRCSEYTEQIYRRKPMPKCDLTLWHGCSSVNWLHIFRTPFPDTSAGLILIFVQNLAVLRKIFLIFLISCSAAKALLPRTIELNIYTLYFLFSFFILFCSNSLSAFLFTCVLVTQSKILSQKSCLSLNTYIYLKLICRLEADSVLDLLQILPQI